MCLVKSRSRTHTRHASHRFPRFQDESTFTSPAIAIFIRPVSCFLSVVRSPLGSVLVDFEDDRRLSSLLARGTRKNEGQQRKFQKNFSPRFPRGPSSIIQSPASHLEIQLSSTGYRRNLLWPACWWDPRGFFIEISYGRPYSSITELGLARVGLAIKFD